VLANAGAGLSEQGRALLREDLRSPWTEEIAVFRAFARAVAEGAALSYSTRPRPGTPSYCWTPPWPTTARCPATPARCRRRSGGCCRGCGTGTAPAC
jgi:hypothetical protein